MDIHYRSSGKGDPILLLHDAQSSLHTWAGWTDKLSEKQQVISIDLPGFGLSTPHPQGSYSAFMYASFLDSFLQKLNLKKVSLAGCGLGAQIAWQFAAESPQRVDKLILLDAPGFEEKKSDPINWLASTPVINRSLWKVTPRSFIKLSLEDVWADDALVTDSLVQRHFDLSLLPGHRKAFTDRASVRDNRPPIDLIERINAPTLILWGAEDTRISPEHAYDFHKRIRGAVLKIYRNTGHWPQEENPVQTAEDVQAFLEGKF
jgi:pimeloyl-ACP methyl ester carboxylesterase